MKLPEKWQKHMESIHETGMGYQQVDILLKDGTVIGNAIVLNCEDIDIMLKNSDEILDIRLASDDLLGEKWYQSKTGIVSLKGKNARLNS